jgi:PqqD family protein of HPr-rel-A system
VNSVYSHHQYTIQTPDNAHFLFKHWDDECVVYNNLSGETHLLEQHSARLLSSISEEPKQYQALLHSLKTTFSETPSEEITDYLNQALDHFQKLVLIEIKTCF